MDTQEYSAKVIVLAGDKMPALHAALGMAGESGEVADIIKKVTFYGKPLDRDHLIEELGDVCWYMNLMMHTIGTTWEEVMDKNVAKLYARFPDGKFDANHAINRDKEAEAQAMSGA